MYYLTKLQLSLRSPCPRGYKRKSFSGTPIRSKHNHLTPVTCWYSRGHGRVILEPWCSSRGWGWGRCSIVMYYWTFGPSQPVLASVLSRSWLGLPAVEGEVLYLFQTDGDVTVGYRSTSGASLVMPMACAIWVFAIRGGISRAWLATNVWVWSWLSRVQGGVGVVSVNVTQDGMWMAIFYVLVLLILGRVLVGVLKLVIA